MRLNRRALSRAGLLAVACAALTAVNVSSASASWQAINFNGQVWLQGRGTLLSNEHDHLDFQADGNLVLYVWDGGLALWASGTVHADGHYETLALQTDGNMVVYDHDTSNNIRVAWTSDTQYTQQAELWLQSDGNLVIYQTEIGYYPVWSTRTNYWPGCGDLC